MTQDTNSTQQFNSPTKIVSLAVFLAAVFTLLGWVEGGLPFSIDPIHSTDDMVRMVMVRDWLAGQSWFDPNLYRLGPSQGTLMHWSRLVDLPIGLLILIGNAFGLNGERFAMIIWPFFLMVMAFAAIIVATRRVAGSIKPVPLVVISGFAVAASGVFASGFVDHHNVQLVLTLWLIAFLTPGGANRVRDLTAAGILTALMLAIGIESLPLAIAGAFAVQVLLISEREPFFPAARAYGLSLALSLCVLFVLLVSPSNYTAIRCDSYSSFQLVCAGLGGVILWLGLLPRIQSRLPRPEWTVPVFAAAFVGLTALVLFPDCLGDPSTLSDAKLKTFWFDGVIETQNVFRIAELDPWLLPYMHILPLLALAFGLAAAIQDAPKSALNTALIFTAIAFAVSLYQYRGTQYATPLAALALTMLVTRFAIAGGERKPVLLLGAIALSCVLVWKVLVQAAMSLAPSVTPGPLMQAAAAGNHAGCQDPQVMANLAAEPVGVVAAANSLGSAILYHTHHRVLSGPYHRNVEGNLAWINAMLGTSEEARAIFAKQGVTILALCPSDADEQEFASAVPNGLAAQLLAGKVPAWLVPVAPTQDGPLKVFHVKP